MRRTAPFTLAVCSLALLAALGAHAESPPQTYRNSIGMTFRAFRLEGHTVAWDNGADFAPEFLRGQIVAQVNAA